MNRSSGISCGLTAADQPAGQMAHADEAQPEPAGCAGARWSGGDRRTDTVNSLIDGGGETPPLPYPLHSPCLLSSLLKSLFPLTARSGRRPGTSIISKESRMRRGAVKNSLNSPIARAHARTHVHVHKHTKSEDEGG